MKKMTKLTLDEMSKIEKESLGMIRFRAIDNNVKTIELTTPRGPLYIEVGSYSVDVLKAATKKVYKLSFFKEVCGDKVFIEKEFDSEGDRQAFKTEHLFDTPEDELTLTEEEVFDR